MNIRIDLPPEVVDEIVEGVTERVLAKLADDNLATTSEPPSPYMTIREAAAFLRCSRQRVDDLLSQRKITRFKDGSRTLVSRAEIEEHLRSEARRRP